MDNISREHIDIYTIRLLYSRYKGFIIPFIVIIIVIGLFVKVTVPAISDLLKGYEEQKEARLVIENIRRNLNFLQSIDDSSLKSQFKIVTKALPLNKDFDSILKAISDSSNNSGVVLAGFKFNVGKLSNDEVESEYPTLKFELSLDGNIYAVDNFIDSLTKTLPLSEIKKIAADTDLSDVTIEFYYKIVKASEGNYTILNTPISEKGLSLIEDLSKLTFTQDSEIDISVSTPSANPFF